MNDMAVAYLTDAQACSPVQPALEHSPDYCSYTLDWVLFPLRLLDASDQPVSYLLSIR